MTATADLPNKNIQDFAEKLSFAAGDKSIIIDSEDGNKLKTIPKTLMVGADGADGPAGADGSSFIREGAYVGGTTYSVDDVVSYLGSSYICILESTGNLPTNATYWELLAAKGADGLGSGDMLKATYDPTNKNANAFSMDNMVETATKKILTSAERTILGNTSNINTGDEVIASGAEVDTGTDNTKMVTSKAMEDSSYIKSGVALPLAGGTMTGKIISAGRTEVGKTYTPASGAQTVALNCAVNNMHIVTGNASGTAITFTIANATESQPFIVSILQGAVVSTITAWFATVRWAGGTAPTLTATANKRDTFGFIRTGTDTYDGFIIGQNC